MGCGAQWCAIANTTGSNKPQVQPWNERRYLRLPAATPATSTIFYAAQAVGRDINGNIVQCDDTSKFDFIGFLTDIIRVQVDPVDVVQQNGLFGDKLFDVEQPITFKAIIAAAAPGDEGRVVFWRFNNEVSYSPGTNGNVAGRVWQVLNPTTVTVLPPWVTTDYFGSAALMTIPGSQASTILTKFDKGKTFLFPSTIAQAVTLPPANKVGNGDPITFIQTGTLAQVVTVSVGNAGDLINSSLAFAATSYALATAQGSKVQFQSDGISNWYQTV